MQAEKLFKEFNEHIDAAIDAEANKNEGMKICELNRAREKLGWLIQRYAKDYEVLTYDDSSGDERCLFSEDDEWRGGYITKK